MKKYIIKTLILILIAAQVVKGQDLSRKQLTNDALYAAGFQAYEKKDYPSAAVYLYAFAQRNPSQLKDKTFIEQLNACFTRAFEQTTFRSEWYAKNNKAYEACKVNLLRCKNGDNSDVTVASIGMTLPPPELPKLTIVSPDTFRVNRDWFGIAYWVASSKYYNKPHVIFFKNAAATTSPIPNLTRIIIPLETEEDKSSVMIMLDGSKRYYGKMAFMNNPDMQSSCTLTGYVEQNEAETIFIVN
jgi:hypothetical protein